MEEWQKKHIIKNLPDLIQNTTCNTLLLTTLVSREIICHQDFEAIEATQGGNINRSKELYRIIQTRIHGYDVLKECLEKTKQTGALAILQRGHDQCSLKHHGSISYDRNKLIGRGCRGTKVYRGTRSAKNVAVKVIDCDDLDAEEALHEVNVLKALQLHDNIVQFCHVEVSDDSVCITLELCSSSLQECIKNKLYPLSRMDILKQTTTGLDYLHQNNIIHRDLKPTNILLMISGDGVVVTKLSDFGMSKIIQEDRMSYTAISAVFGTQGWMAPEVIRYFGSGDGTSDGKSAGRLSFSSDVFSLGCIYYFTLTDGVHPFEIPARCEANILDGVFELDAAKLQEGDEETIIMIQLMIDNDYDNRPSCSDTILNHGFAALDIAGASSKSAQKPQRAAHFPQILSDARKSYQVDMTKVFNLKKGSDPKELRKHHNMISDDILKRVGANITEAQKVNLVRVLNTKFETFKETNEMNLNSEKEITVGIDLGATYSSIAFYKMGEVHVVRNPKGKNTTPTFISFKTKDKPTFGVDAKWEYTESPQTSVFDLKRIIGKDVDTIKLDKRMWEWLFLIKKDGQNNIQIEGTDWSLSPEEIVTLILAELCGYAEAVIGHPITKAVVAIPGYYTEEQKQALRRSGEPIGLQILGFIFEAEAIALAYKFRPMYESVKTILVFDLGGRSLNIALLKCEEGKFRIMAQETDQYLGGDDFDRAMVEYACQEIKNRFGLDLISRKDSTVTVIKERSRQKIRELQQTSEQAKILLSTNDSALIEAGSFDHQGIFHTQIFLTSLFQNRKMLELVDKVLEGSRVSKRDVDDIILSGGGAKIPKIQEMLKDHFGGKSLTLDIDPEEVVAHGAAICAALLNK